MDDGASILLFLFGIEVVEEVRMRNTSIRMLFDDVGIGHVCKHKFTWARTTDCFIVVEKFLCLHRPAWTKWLVRLQTTIIYSGEKVSICPYNFPIWRPIRRRRYELKRVLLLFISSAIQKEFISSTQKMESGQTHTPTHLYIHTSTPTQTPSIRRHFFFIWPFVATCSKDKFGELKTICFCLELWRPPMNKRDSRE